VRASIASPSVLPSPYRWRVGFRIFTFEACSGFTLITARWIAQPPKATFVARLQRGSHPTALLASYQTNRQLSGWIPPPLVTHALLGAHSDIRDSLVALNGTNFVAPQCGGRTHFCARIVKFATHCDPIWRRGCQEVEPDRGHVGRCRNVDA
jgi:hypothetical protein